jgi:hypothetical protein
MAASAQAAQLYRWVDADGKVHYTDTPPPKEAKDIEKKRVRTAADAIPMPYALQQAAKTFPVTVYNADCGAPCDQARALLEKRGIPHTARNAREPEVQADLKKVTGSQDIDVPVLQVGRNVVKGWEAGQWNNALDAAGYPKSAVWKQPAVKPDRKAQKDAPKAPAVGQDERPAASTESSASR